MPAIQFRRLFVDWREVNDASVGTGGIVFWWSRPNCSTPKHHARSAWFAGLWLLLFGNVGTAGIPWQDDLRSATSEASKSSKLVMVVDLPTSTIAGDPTAEANDAFLVGSVGSDRLDEILRHAYLPVLRSVGVPRLETQPKAKQALPKRGSTSPGDATVAIPTGRPVTYFCAPIVSDSIDKSIDEDGEVGALLVIHLCVGYVGADRLAEAARWALDSYQSCKAEAATEMKADLGELLRTAHVDVSVEHDVSQLDSSVELLRNSRSRPSIHSSRDVRKVLQSTLRFCERDRQTDLNRTLATSLNGADVDARLVRGIAPSAKADAGHLSLTRLSGIRLRPLEQHCYEILARGQCYRSDTPRVRSLEAFLRDCSNRGKIVLCPILESEVDTNGELILNDLLALPMVARRLENVETVPMLEGELSAIQQRRRATMRETSATGNLRFALFNARGELTHTIYDSEPMARSLARHLDRLHRVANAIGHRRSK